MYEVLNPWAEADPIPLRGINARSSDLTGKKIGLFYNSKRAAQPTSVQVEKELKKRYPSIVTSWYKFSAVNVPEVETVNQAIFEDWLKGVDAVILTYGD
jgi:hypothetical protein